MKVVVVGGTGYLGALAVAALQRVEGIEVAVASRRGPVRIDLADPSTFEALRAADVVVDLADATTTPPDALARFCLDEGLTLLEATSDREAVERLHAELSGRQGPGAVVLGAGIFTGLSNLLVRSVVDARTERVDLAIRSSPYSGAGSGTVALMVAALRQGARAFVGGAARIVPGVGRGPRVAFPSGEAPSIEMSLAEPWMIHHATGVRDVHAYFAPKPSVLTTMFLALPARLLCARWFGAGMRLWFGLLRRFVLRSVATRVELVASTESRARALVAEDGMGAGGAAVAAIVACLPTRIVGVNMVDEVVSLARVLQRMQGLPRGQVSCIDLPVHGGSSVRGSP
jgi:hypothetical protein